MQYINKYFEGNQAAFGRAQNVRPAQVTQWLKKDVLIVDDKLYMVRRKLYKPIKNIKDKES